VLIRRSILTLTVVIGMMLWAAVPAGSVPGAPPTSGHGGSTTSLPDTGSDILLPLIIGLVAVGLGAVLLVVSRRSQRRD
jgi:LPXTG-motif cell wall-anchored protein